MKSRARWAEDATDLSNDLAKAANYLTLPDLADATGLAQSTIMDRLTREKITSETNPRGAIDRPAASVGGDPLWSSEQLAEFKRRKALRLERDIELPLISPEDADQRGLISTNELAARLGIHDQTVRGWEADFAEYPEAVARRSRDGRPGVPEHVRVLADIVAWIARRNGENAAEGKAPLARLDMFAPGTSSVAS